MHQGAVGRVAGFDRLDSVFCCVGSFWGVEAEIGLALFGIEPVAREAVVREDGADVSVEVDGFVGCAEDCSWDESGDDEEGGEKRRSDHDGVGGCLGVCRYLPIGLRASWRKTQVDGRKRIVSRA